MCRRALSDKIIFYDMFMKFAPQKYLKSSDKPKKPKDNSNHAKISAPQNKSTELDGPEV